MTIRIAIAPGHASSMNDVVKRLEHYLRSHNQRKSIMALAYDAGFDLEHALAECGKTEPLANRFAQPLQFLLGYAAWTSSRDDESIVDGVAGHSLGEFLAVACQPPIGFALRCGHGRGAPDQAGGYERPTRIQHGRDIKVVHRYPGYRPRCTGDR